LTRRYRSALVAALACASLFVASLASEAAAKRAGAKSAPATTAKAAGKAAKPSGKKVAAGKSKGGKSSKEAVSQKSVVPQIPLAQGPAPQTSDAEIALVRSAIDALRKGGASKATDVAAAISDPAARKLVEWIILRSDHNGANSKRFLAFIAANPNWPNLAMFRRRAEAMLWVENVKPAQALAFFNGSPPQSGMGRLVLARALTEQGDTETASALVRETWRSDSLSADVEKQVLERYSEFLTRADHKARMEKRLAALDHEPALRAARRLEAADLAIAQARIALTRKAGNTKKLLDAVPAEARRDPGYLFARAHVLRHDGKLDEAAQVLLSAPRDLAQVHDGEEWWIERRVMSRKLLDLGDARSAYQVVADAAEPSKENSRVERHFMAGWIALRYLDDPATAATHFARIQDVSSHPTSLARMHYWLGRVAEALHRPDQARAEYQAAAGASASYYGQLARAKLGLSALALAPPPATPDKHAEAERLELVRALEILYALNERPLVIALMSGLGNTLDDVGTLSALGELAEQYHDARGMLHLGKAALARGLPLDYYAFPTVGVPRYSPISPDIERAMLFAIIRQESAFDPSDWSSAQAMGLMQVTPEAGRDTCKRFSCSYDVKRLRHDSPYNLQVGAAELAGLMQDYRSNYILVFAGYNAGRGRVQEWIATFGDPRNPKVDPIDWVERIPFMETRNYVQRVMENLQVYRTRFDNDAPLTADTDLRRDAAAH
jgi:soluble lytic murein transglycosylase